MYIDCTVMVLSFTNEYSDPASLRKRVSKIGVETRDWSSTDERVCIWRSLKSCLYFVI